jgi:hypothetical protein
MYSTVDYVSMKKLTLVVLVLEHARILNSTIVDVLGTGISTKAINTVREYKIVRTPTKTDTGKSTRSVSIYRSIR